MQGITWNCLLKSCYKKICIYELSFPCWISDSDARNPDEVVSNMPFPAFTYTCGIDKKIKKNNALMYLANYRDLYILSCIRITSQNFSLLCMALGEYAKVVTFFYTELLNIKVIQQY